MEVPFYHSRPKGSRPEAVPSTTKYRVKLNVWGGISYLGATNFAVSIIKKI